MANNQTSTDKVLEVNRNVIESFLELIRDKYHIVDQANYFLESRTGASGVNIAMVNQRDFISHFCTVLKNHTLTEQQQLDQLSAAEEHLRRAIIECYQRSVNIKIITIEDVLDQYKSRVIPNIGKMSELKGAPDLLEIRNKLIEIRDLQSGGRKAKSINKWTPEWEKGVKTFIDAFDMAENIENILNHYLSKLPTKSPPWKSIALLLSLVVIILVAALFL